MQVIGSDPALFQRYAEDEQFRKSCEKANAMTEGKDALKTIIYDLLERVDNANG